MIGRTSLNLLRRCVVSTPSLRVPMFVVPRSTYSTGKQGFASMDPLKQREAASKGGLHSQQGSTSFNNMTSNLNTSHKPQAPISNDPRQNTESIEVMEGDLVRFSAGAHMTEGIILSVSKEPFTDNVGKNHRATADNPIAKIENFYTKHITYHHLTALEYVARKEDYPGYIQDKTDVPNEAVTETGQKRQEKVMAEKEKLAPQIEVKVSPSNLRFSEGDFVRFNAGRSYTAGVIKEILFRDFHDENGRFHKASSDAPMAKIENLWSKNVSFHYLNILQPVKHVADVIDVQAESVSDFGETVDGTTQDSRTTKTYF